jgi:hypothetical protein
MGRVSDREPKATRRPPFAKAIAILRGLYGKPKPPAVTDPFQQILWENVAYGGNLQPILKLPLKDVKRALRKFPSIG